MFIAATPLIFRAVRKMFPRRTELFSAPYGKFNIAAFVTIHLSAFSK